MSPIILETIFTVLKAYLMLWVLQLISWPIAKKFFDKLPDEGWGLSRFLGLMGVSLGIWEVSHMGVPANTNLGIKIGLLILLLISILIIKKLGLVFLKPKTSSFKTIFLEEYLFLVGFAGICLVRSFLPNLDSLEKFMDYGFIVRYINSPTLPAMDMWQAGNYINYYSFGHFWASVLIRFVGTSPEIGYNLMLGFVAGISLSLSFLTCLVLGRGVKTKGSMIGALLGSLLVVFGGNSHLIWYFLKNHSMNGYWYADATRFIHNTIHEFPSYSLVVSDLHGHLLDLPSALVFILFLYLFIQYSKILVTLLIGVLFATMMMTNTWDVPIYGLLCGVVFLIEILRSPEKIGNLIKKAFIIFGVMILVSLPWWLKFQPISSGIAFVTQRSPLWQLGVLWGLALAVNVVAWIASKKSDSGVFVKSLIVTSILLVLIPELVYAKDIYPDHPRANTMFKLTYQASIMIGLIFGSSFTKIADQLKNKFTYYNSVLITSLLLIFGSLIVYPAFAFPAFYENFNTFRGLNGEDWIKEKSPEKYDVINFLKNNKDGKNLVEAVGDSYTEKNVVSVFSGVPSIQGWRVHEWLWRGGYQSVSVREQEVKEIYEGEKVEASKLILDKYNIGWIFVGLDESGSYIVNNPKVRSLGKEAWKMGNSYLIKVEN